MDGWRIAKAALFVLCGVPLLRLVHAAGWGDLGANPVETLTHATGDWALYLLLATLAITPLRRLLALPRLASLRRLFGLYAFFYATLHVVTFLLFDHEFDVVAILADIAERPFVLLGLTAWLLLLPLAITSTDGWMRRLGRHWQALHRLVYPAAVAVIWHYGLLVKADLTRPVAWGLVLVALLAFRAASPRWQQVPWLRLGWRRLGAPGRPPG